MATQVFGLAVSGSSVLVAPYNPDRRGIYVRNYAASAGTIWLTFGGTNANGQPITQATAGGAGEMEIVPGTEYSFGGLLHPTKNNRPLGFNFPSCPLEAIYIYGSSATGCLITQ
jgi:hypothetical protein